MALILWVTFFWCHLCRLERCVCICCTEALKGFWIRAVLSRFIITLQQVKDWEYIWSATSQSRALLASFGVLLAHWWMTSSTNESFEVRLFGWRWFDPRRVNGLPWDVRHGGGCSRGFEGGETSQVHLDQIKYGHYLKLFAFSQWALSICCFNSNLPGILGKRRESLSLARGTEPSRQ